MEKIENEKEENKIIEVGSAITVGFLSEIPFVGGVISELAGYVSEKRLKERLRKLEQTINDMGISLEEISDKIYALEDNEHKYYVVRNNLKHLCLTALPETVDSFNRALVEVIIKDEPTMAEYACEILQDLNADDIMLLQNIKRYQIKLRQAKDDGRSQY